MRLFRRRRAKATSSHEREIHQSNEDLDGSNDSEGFQIQLLPAGEPPCSCQPCKRDLPCSKRPTRLELQPTVFTRLNHGFGTVTVGTQTVSTQNMTCQTKPESDSQYEAEIYPKYLVKTQHMASQTDFSSNPKKTQHMSDQTYPEFDDYTNDDIYSRANDSPRKRENSKSNKAQLQIQKEKYRKESKLKTEKNKYNQNEGFWRRPIIVTHSNKIHHNNKVKFLKDTKVTKPYENDDGVNNHDDYLPPDIPITTQENKSPNSPNCNKVDELNHEVYRLHQRLERQEWYIQNLQNAVNTLQKQGTAKMKDEYTQTVIQKGEELATIQPESLPKRVCDHLNVNNEATCQCGTLYEQFLRIFMKPEENQQTENLLSTCDVARSSQLNDNNCPRAKIFDLDNLFREFMRLFMKPTETEADDCNENKNILSICSPLESPKTVSTCSSSSSQIPKLEIPKKDKKKRTKFIKFDSSKKNTNKAMSATSTFMSSCKISDPKLTKLDECPCPSQQKSTKNLPSNALLQRQQSSLCQFCSHKNLPVLDDLINELIKLIDNTRFKDVVLTVLLRADNVYHVNVREIETGRVLGCLLVSDEAIDEAISSGLFENIVTYFVVDVRSTIKPKVRPFGIPFEFIHDDSNSKDRQRQQAGENYNFAQRESKIWEVTVKVLGLPMEYKERMVCLTNAIKLAKQKSHYQLQTFSRTLERSQRVASGDDDRV